MTNKNKAVIATALGGMIVGTLALLFTTKKGKKIRKKAKEKGKQVIDSLKNMEGCRNK